MLTQIAKYDQEDTFADIDMKDFLIREVPKCFCQDPYEGVYSCEGLCGMPLTCGYHSCTSVCHGGQCGPCLLSPELITTCVCGQMESRNIPFARENCTDPTDTCSGICEKQLPCGLHFCKINCHEGMGPPCDVLLSFKWCCKKASSWSANSSLQTKAKVKFEGFLLGTDLKEKFRVQALHK